MAGDKPKVSVILSSYEGEDRIAGAIDSVLAQTFADFELVIVDDGSRDGTSRVVDGYRNDSRVLALRLPANAGLYKARTAAIEASSAPLLAFIDDDDVWLPHKLEVQVQTLEARPDIALLHATVIDQFPSGKRRVRRVHRHANSYLELLCQDRIATSSVVLRRKAFDQVGGYDTSFRAFGDWDMWTRVAAEFTLGSTPEPLALIRLRENSIQRGSVENFEHYRLKAIEKRLPELRRHGLELRANSLHDYAVAAKLHLHGLPQEARKRALQSLRDHPSAEAAALIALTLLPAPLAHQARLNLRTMRGWLRI